MHAGRRALVTGAARGIGLGIAQRLLREGADVALADSDSDALKDALRQLPSDGGRAFTVTCDVSSEQDVNKMVEQVTAAFGGIDILVNNAGISPKHGGRKATVVEMGVQEWRGVLDVNLTGALLCARACLPGMIERRWGRIVHIASQAGRTRSEISGAHYGASKAGLASLARTLACEVGELGITANSVAPGRIDTPMAQTVSAEVNERYRAGIPVRRFGTPDDVAAAVSYLASDHAGFVTGVTLDVNGGAFMI
ncbi:MAG: SDR family oxidoreductase [Comamonadaceae bacterium]|nr:MAG: SDR family oxidoreductase [Comamonadaceae bacterium]